jgi:hypothetical protein
MEQEAASQSAGQLPGQAKAHSELGWHSTAQGATVWSHARSHVCDAEQMHGQS